MEYANLSVEEIQRQLEEAQTRKVELEKMLEARHQAGKDGMVQQVKDLILSNGYDIDEILAMVSPKCRRGGRRGSAGPRRLVTSRQYKRYVDPDNSENVYVRGVLPGWMKQKMTAQGLDPSSKDDRETFKASSLRLIES